MRHKTQDQVPRGGFGGSVMTTSEDALIRDGESLEVPSQPTEPRTRRLVLVSSTQVDPVPQRRTVSGPRHRRRKIQWEGSDSRPPTVAGGPIHHDLTLIDSSDEDAPFTVPRAAFPARPSRRVVLVPGSVEATPQSIQDRGGVETLNTQSDIFSCAGAREGARVAAVPESFGRWSTIPASRSAFHARSVELPQPRISNSARFAVLGEDTDDDETQSVGAVSHVGSNDTGSQGRADDEAESTLETVRQVKLKVPTRKMIIQQWGTSRRVVS